MIRIKNFFKKIMPASFIEFVRNKKERLFNKNLQRQRENFYQQFLQPGDLVFDIGANKGNRIDAFLGIKANVVAVEPQQKCVAYLNARFKNNIVVVSKGVGSQEEERHFYVSSTSTLSTFSEEWVDVLKKGRFKGYKWQKKEKIQLTTLDQLISQYGIPAFIKIDVEGFELEVLKGFNHPVRMLSFEYAVPEFLERAQACIERLASISSNVEYNYAIGENLSFRLDKWKSASEMSSYLNTQEFIQTGFGDLYARFFK
jgi:FkbM family methyltransferase